MANKVRVALYYGADVAAGKEKAAELRDTGKVVILLEAQHWMGDREQVDEVDFTDDVDDAICARIEKAYSTSFHAGDEADENEFVSRPGLANETGAPGKEIVIPADYADLSWQKLTSLANRVRDPDAPMVRNKAEALEIIEAKYAEQKAAAEQD